MIDITLPKVVDINLEYILLTFFSIILYFTLNIKNRRLTCKKYYVNYVVIILLLFTLLFSTLKVLKNSEIKLDMKKNVNVIITNIVIFIGLMVIYLYDNSIAQVVMMVVIVITIAISKTEINTEESPDERISKYKYLLLMLVICFSLRFMLEKKLNTRNEIILFIISVLSFAILTIDQKYIEGKYNQIIHYIIILIFSIFIIFDINRFINKGKSCSRDLINNVFGNPSYIENTMGLFLNIITIYISYKQLQITD